MIKLAQLDAAARVAASRKRSLEALALFLRHEDGGAIRVWLDDAQHTLKGPIANQVVDLITDDLRKFVGEASEALACAGVDLAGDDVGETPMEAPRAEAPRALGTPPAKDKPRCVAIKPCGYQCCNSAYEVGGLCGVHLRMHRVRALSRDAGQEPLPTQPAA